MEVYTRIISQKIMDNQQNTQSLDRTKQHMYHLFKRITDIITGVIGMLITLIIAACIKVIYLATGDKDSIFYVQKRIGKDGKTFDIYKFRTMIVGADRLLSDALNNDEKLKSEYEKNRKLDEDPRVTKIGKILRNTSIDEMPQFLNVLKGDMSLIGNRPYMLTEQSEIGKLYFDIIKTKPGLTGLWQVSGRSERTFKQRIRLEAFYSNKNSYKLDKHIFLKTFKVLATRMGAK